MKSEIKQILEAKGGKIRREKQMNKFIRSLKGRFEKHGTIFISRYEFKKFGLTEKQLRTLIEKFRGLGLLVLKGKKRKNGNKYFSNEYSIGYELKHIFDLLVGGIVNMFEKVKKFVDNNGIEVLKEYGVKLFNERKNLIEKKVSISKKGQIKNWKTGKGYNIFSYLMEFKNMSCFELAKELKL